MSQVIIVGGGLSGLSAAHTVLERGGRVLLLDKNPYLGGNSTKATSGINGALTKTQIKQNIPDSPEKFYEDTALSARDLVRPPLVRVLTYNSASAVEWLQDKFKLDLSLVSRLGGHSFPRTHRGKEMFPGMTITYALMEMLEEIAKQHPEQVQIVKKADVKHLLKENGAVVGVEYFVGEQSHKASGSVILATGGYGADFTETGLLKKYRPDVLPLPTTNGDHTTGDGIKMVMEIGGSTTDLEKVQVHPTGLVDPKEPDAKLKFLAAEALRGVGGILLNKEGDRFCDELGHRDYVTGQMWKNARAPYRLVLNGAAAKEIEWHCKHYMGRGLMKRFTNGTDLAKEMGIPVSKLNDTFTKYNEYAQKKNDPFGKKYFHNLPITTNDEFWVAIVTPVVHYCMGGLEINDEGKVLEKAGAIPGLFACGEVAGGVHGANRLGGSSLLGCVVFGRVAGDSAAKYTLTNLSSGRAGAGGNVGRLGANITIEPGTNKVSLELSWNESGNVGVRSSSQPTTTSTTSTPSAVPAAGQQPQQQAKAAPAAPKADKNKEWTLEEISKHNTEKDCWVIVNGQVLDVTNFLKEHPGGKKPILIYAGRDATTEFNMLHKADVVDKYAPESIIGKVKPSAKL